MAKTKNEYIYPIKLTEKVRISYKDSPAHAGKLKHAVDFICKERLVVRAALEGVVVDVKDGSTIGGGTQIYDKYGNYVEIEHSDGEYSIYEHLRLGIPVKVGDMVETGQIIGYTGKTGWIAHLGPHLHFDVHKYHKPFGPEDYKTIEIQWKNSTSTRAKQSQSQIP